MAQMLHLIVLGGNVEFTVAGKIAVDAVTLNRGLNLGEISQSKPIQGAEFRGPAFYAVGMSVSDGCGQKTTVAPGGRGRDPVTLHHYDMQVRVPFLGPQCRPQPRQTGSDHHQIGLGAP